MSRARRALVTTVLAVAGAALLVWQLQRVGVEQVRDGLTSVGWGFLLVVGISFLRFVVRAAAWLTLLGERVPFTRALAAVIAGDAVSKTPLSVVLSEPAKALYLGNPAGPARAFAALTAENFFYGISLAVYIALGTTAMLEAFQLPDGVVAAGRIALVGAAGILAVAAWMAWQRPALVSGALGRFPIPRLAAMVNQIRDFETQAYGAAGHERARLGVVALCELAFHVLSFMESWLTLLFLTGTSMPLEAFVLDTFSRIVNVVFAAVPLKLGIDQFGSSEVAVAIGLERAVGLNVSLVRTLRQIVWIPVGVALWVRRGRIVVS